MKYGLPYHSETQKTVKNLNDTITRNSSNYGFLA